MQLSWTRRLFLVLSLLFLSSCASQTSYKFLEKETVLGDESATAEESNQVPQASASEDNDSENSKQGSRSWSVQPTGPSNSPKMLMQGSTQQTSPRFEVTPHPLSPKSLVMSNQELVDSALEFCQTSSDYWEQGDLENAIDALDKAYSLILKVGEDAEPELLQQKEDLRITISRRVVEVYASRFTAANGDHKVIPLVMNSHVERALSLFKGREREFFLSSYRRSGRYRPQIVKSLKEAGLPEELSWLPLIESGFKIRAMSRARALGMWQFIASTGYKFGLKRDMWIDERMDPEKSTRAAIAYLKELHQIFGDWTTVLAAYNCGERRVLNRIKSQRINYLDNFWDLYERLPRETAFYVPKFLAVLHILNDPEAHGFTLPPVDEELRAERVDINKQVHLKTIAGRLDVDYGFLKELNPELRHHLTPSEPYVLKVPPGKGEVLLAKLDDIPVWRPPVPAYVVHRVRYGESLSVIASKYGTSVRAIMNMNGLRRRNYLKVGWKLRIPVKKTRFTHLARPPIQTSRLKGEIVEYTVQKGDSLWLIARRFGTTTKMIRSLNQLNTSVLRVGQVLKIAPGRMVMKLEGNKTHLVREGDSPYLIAKKYEMELSEFLKINNLTPRSTIFPGEIVTIKAE
ncbi:MAG: LysM peptidoglycan-binding domain-containing protein [Desulfobacteraceae bacterium]